MALDCSASSLAKASACLMCLTEKQLIAVIAYVLCTQGTGGGGGGGAIQVRQDATGSPPPDPTLPAISFPTGGGGISEWDVASQTWI